MSGIRSAILQDLFNSADSTETTRDHSGPASLVYNAINSEPTALSMLSELDQDLGEISDRLDVLCASSFNVATLLFFPGSQSIFADQCPTVTSCEHFLVTLVPTAPSSQIFMHKVRSLQALMVDLEAIRLNYSTLPGELNLASKCDDILSCIEIDFHRLILAAWQVGQQQATLRMDHQALGVKSFDYCECEPLAVD
jgi:hypothetical protein